SSEYSRELVLRQEPAPRVASVAYLEPLQPLAQPEEDSGGLPALWQMVRNHRLTIVLATIGGAAAGLALGLIQTPIYEAKTTLIFQSTRVGDSMAGMSEPDSGGLTAESYLQTQVREMKSRTMMKRVVDKLAKETPDGYRTPDPVEKIRNLV